MEPTNTWPWAVAIFAQTLKQDQLRAEPFLVLACLVTGLFICAAIFAWWCSRKK
jgi:hypothetical protein